MISPVTMEQVEELGVQLPPQAQLKLLARLSERLSRLPFAASETIEERQRQE